MPTFAVIVEHGPRWDPVQAIRQQNDWDAHAAFMDRLVAQGTIILGGPLDEGTNILHLVNAEDEADARLRLGADPWHRHGLLRIQRVHAWYLWLDSRAKGSGA